MDSHLEKITARAADSSIGELLQYLASEYGRKAVFSTSFGIEDQVLTYLIASQQLDISFFTLDTGRLFEETYFVWDVTVAKYGIHINTFYPNAQKISSLMSEKGPNSFYESIANRQHCCHIRKVEPLKRAIAGKKVWITGIRAEQSNNRSEQPMVEWDEANQIIKVHPLLHWTFEQVQVFVDENKVPVNLLHKKGFVSIGCAPCTRAIEPGEDFRAGRWWWEHSKRECGLHSHG